MCVVAAHVCGRLALLGGGIVFTHLVTHEKATIEGVSFELDFNEDTGAGVAMIVTDSGEETVVDLDRLLSRLRRVWLVGVGGSSVGFLLGACGLACVCVLVVPPVSSLTSLRRLAL